MLLRESFFFFFFHTFESYAPKRALPPTALDLKPGHNSDAETNSFHCWYKGVHDSSLTPFLLTVDTYNVCLAPKEVNLPHHFGVHPSSTLIMWIKPDHFHLWIQVWKHNQHAYAVGSISVPHLTLFWHSYACHHSLSRRLYVITCTLEIVQPLPSCKSAFLFDVTNHRWIHVG